MLAIKLGASSLSVFVREPKQRCVTSFISHLSLADEVPVWLSSWQHPNAAASEDWALTAPPLKHPCRGFLHTVARGEGVKVKVWHPATDLQQGRPLLPGCSHSATWSQVASDLTSPPREPVGWEAEIPQKWKKQANLLGRKERIGGRGDCGGTAWNKVLRNRSTSISFFLLSL